MKRAPGTRLARQSQQRRDPYIVTLEGVYSPVYVVLLCSQLHSHAPIPSMQQWSSKYQFVPAIRSFDPSPSSKPNQAIQHQALSVVQYRPASILGAIPEYVTPKWTQATPFQAIIITFISDNHSSQIRRPLSAAAYSFHQQHPASRPW